MVRDESLSVVELLGLDVGEAQLVESPDGVVLVQVPDRVEHLVLDLLLQIPRLVRDELAVVFEVEEDRFGTGVAFTVEHFHEIAALDGNGRVMLRGRSVATADRESGGENEKGIRELAGHLSLRRVGIM